MVKIGVRVSLGISIRAGWMVRVTIRVVSGAKLSYKLGLRPVLGRDNATVRASVHGEARVRPVMERASPCD